MCTPQPINSRSASCSNKGLSMKIKVKESTGVSDTYEALLEAGLFTEDELVLVTDGWGLNEDTLDRVCQVRYAMDADQLLESLGD